MIKFAKNIAMESRLSEELQELYRKVGVIAAQRDEALAAGKRLERENSDLREELEATRQALAQSRTDAEYLSLSHKLADNPEALAQARTTVRKMIGRLDRAIALLKDDARI